MEKIDFGTIYQQITNDIQMNREEAWKLYRCAEAISKDGIIVEIGTFKGGSAMIMAAATEATIYTIDIVSQQIIEKVKEFPNINLICGYSKDIAAGWDKGEIDMLFIDGDHTYDLVMEDIKGWLPRVKDGGIVCFHDYGSRPEVTHAVTDTLEQRIGLPSHSLLTIIK